MPSSREAVIGFARQTAKGSVATTPTYEIPMGGGHASPNREIGALPWTNDSQDPLGHYVSFIGGVVQLSGLPMLPVSSVALWNAILGTVTTTGAGPYSHDVTPNDELDWWTVFYAEPSGDFVTVPDVKFSDATLNGSAGQPLTFDLNGEGGAPTYSDAKWGSATLVEGVDPFFSFIKSTLKIDAATTPASTTVTNIPSFSLTVNRNTESIQTNDISASERIENQREIAVEIPDLVLSSNDFRRTIITGSSSGTAMSSQVAYGALEFTFIGSDGAAAATRSLKVALPRLLWATEPIEADPSGGTVRFALRGEASKPAAGVSITTTIKNADSGSNY